MLYVLVTDPPSLINITVEETGITFITISWISTSVGSVIYTITGDVMVSFTTIDTQYTINGLTVVHHIGSVLSLVWECVREKGKK